MQRKSFVFLFLFATLCFPAIAQETADSLNDSAAVQAQPDSLTQALDSVALRLVTADSLVRKWLAKNQFINAAPGRDYVFVKEYESPGREFLFYLLLGVVLVFGLFKTFYSGYFNNLFRVFFNTSLRQNQLTDQLVQARLPSFILNIFFTITAGIYLWLSFSYFHPGSSVKGLSLLLLCVAGIGALYLAKFISLKFLGWLYTVQEVMDNYIFIIFLINKILGIVLVPLIIVFAFSKEWMLSYINIICILAIVLFFLTRYLKTYTSLDREVSMNLFHFLIYVLATEIVPLALVYKVTTDYLI